MFCQRCGAQNPDNANFCQGCGSPLNKPSQENSAGNYTYQSALPNPTVYSEPAPESPSAALRKVATSGLFRFTAFAFCTLILSNILVLLDTSFMWGAFTEIFRNIDPNMVNEASGYLGSINLFSAIISSIPGILIAVGLWMTYATAASKKGGRFNTAGLTMIKVIYTIELVAVCILLAICMVALLIASITSTSSEDAMLAFMSVLVIDVIFAVVIFWLAMIIKSLNAAKRAATEEHGKRTGKNASAFVGVVCYIGGAINILSAIFSIMSLSIVSFCNCAIGAAVQICFGVLIFRFRKEMKRLK
ncbi:MAG: zinc ribbon domain-containing protein [Oscillospiraceae bacterium]|nr:zinc ribbon domain-containing protein [Oscillospiraceae bacterium]